MPRGILRGKGSSGPMVEVPVSGAKTTNGTGAPVPAWGGHHQMAVRLAITAKAGTAPSVQLIIEDSDDGTTWGTLDTFPVQTDPAIPTTVDRVMPRTSKNYVRTRWVIGGSAGQSITFTTKFARHQSQLNF